VHGAAAGIEIVEPRAPQTVRSPCDVLRLVVAAVLVLALFAIEWWWGGTLVDFAFRLARGLDAVPPWLLDTIVTATRLLAAVFLVGGFVVAATRAGWRFVAVVASAAGLAALLTVVAEHIDPHSAHAVVDLNGLVPPGFPTAIGLSTTVAVATAAAPWLSRQWRRIAWLLIIGAAISRFLVAPIGFDTLRGVLLGWFAGAAALVALGGPNRRPRGAAIVAGLARSGVALTRLERADVDARGSSPYFGVTTDGTRVFVKALGADERSADLLFRMYRALVPHDLGDAHPFGSLRRAVEHEALVALSARNAGARTPRLVALAPVAPNGFALAFEAIDGRSVDGVPTDALTDAVLRSVWAQVDELHATGTVHRDLRLANVFLAADGTTWLIDFGFGELAASELLVANDRAELVASTATRVGVARAVRAAVAVVGAERMYCAVDRLQPWALSGATRAAAKQDPELLPALRNAIVAASSGAGVH
jgi:undecaprenyl-diphosphatase